MRSTYTGVQVVEDCNPQVIDALFAGRKVLTSEVQFKDFPYPNSFVVLKHAVQKSALGRISPDGERIISIKSMKIGALEPRNKEQQMLLSTLMAPEIPVQLITGRAGTGKTMLALAAAIEQIEQGIYDRIILSKPMSQVGKYDLGTLPGHINEKFYPFLMNFSTNLDYMLQGQSNKAEEKRKGSRVKSDKQESAGAPQGVIADFMQQYRVEMVPIQVLRGASFHKSFIIVDEIQVLGHHEVLTIGTRVGEGSKLVMMGDLDQRDDRIAKDKTGLFKAMNDERMKKSPLVSHIELRKVERGPVAELFAEVFEESSAA